MDPGRSWQGTATQLLDALTERAKEGTTRREAWPKSPSALSNKLRRLAPHLRAVDIDITWNRKPGGNRRRLIHIEACGDGPGADDGTGEGRRQSGDKPLKTNERDGGDGRDDDSRLFDSFEPEDQP